MRGRTRKGGFIREKEQAILARFVFYRRITALPSYFQVIPLIEDDVNLGELVFRDFVQPIIEHLTVTRTVVTYFKANLVSKNKRKFNTLFILDDADNRQILPRFYR